MSRKAPEYTLTMPQLVEKIQDITGQPKPEIAATIQALRVVIQEEVKNRGGFRITGIVEYIREWRPSRPGVCYLPQLKGKKWTTKARYILRARVPLPLRKIVSQKP